MLLKKLNLESTSSLEHNTMKIINIHDEIVNMAYALREAYENMTCHVDKNSPENIKQTVQNLYRYVVLSEKAIEEVKAAAKEQNEKKLATELHSLKSICDDAYDVLRSFEEELQTFYRSKQPKNYGKYQ